MILGILSIVLFCTCINIPLAIAAVIFGVLQLSKNQEGRVFSILGIVTSAISVILFIIMLALVWSPLQNFYREMQYQDFEDYYEDDYKDFFENNFDYDFELPMFPGDSDYSLPGADRF